MTFTVGFMVHISRLPDRPVPEDSARDFLWVFTSGTYTASFIESHETFFMTRSTRSLGVLCVAGPEGTLCATLKPHTRRQSGSRERSATPWRVPEGLNIENLSLVAFHKRFLQHQSSTPRLGGSMYK